MSIKNKNKLNKLLGKSSEPLPSIMGIVDNITLVKSLNWYNVNVDNKKLKIYLTTYANNIDLELHHLNDNECSTYGAIARMFFLGFKLSEETIDRLNNFCLKSIETKPNKQKSTTHQINKKNNIVYDVILEQLEYSIDDIIHDLPTTYKIPTKKNDIKLLLNHIECILLVLDEDYKEKCICHTQYTKIKKHLLSIKSKSLIVKKSNTTRKSITKNKSTIVKNVKCCISKQQFTTKIITPIDVIGMRKMYTYDTKTNKIKMFIGVGEGFTFSGTTLKNFDVDKSKEKTLKCTKELDFCRKIGIINTVFKNSTRVEKRTNGRFSDTTVILYVT